MSRIDEELEQALRESEANAENHLAEAGGTAQATSATVTPSPEDSASSTRRSLGLLVALLVMGAAILVFVLGKSSDEFVYSKEVHEVLGAKEQLAERNLKMQGILVQGSLMKRDQPCEYRFKLRPLNQADGEAIDVRYAACIVPDTFRDVKGMDVEVTAEGKLTAAGDAFEAKHILAKCPSKYEMQQREALGEQSPHGGGKPDLNPMANYPAGAENLPATNTLPAANQAY